MKRKEKFDNNKGAALISVMIAVTFITIVASALLYMAYMNFSMKAMSVQSKANFYETEGYLQGVTVKLQDEIARSTDPATTINNLTESSNYSAVKLLKLKYPAATGNAASATVVIDGDTITLDRGGSLTVTDYSSKTKKYTLSNVKITQVNEDGLTNNIKTDIVYYVTKESTAADAGGVGEFSMMLDGSVSSNGQEFTFMNVYGNTFLTATEDYTNSSGVNVTAPGKASNGKVALSLTGSSKMNIVGDYCVVYGDVVLDGNSALVVTQGNLCVYGDIYLNGNSTLICAGKIYMVQEALTDYGRTDVTTIHAGDGNLNKHLYPSTLAISPIGRDKFDSFVAELKYNDSDKSNDGLLNQILKADGAEFYDTEHSTNKKFKYFDIKDQKSGTTTKLGKTFGWAAYGANTNINGSDLNNKLNFIYTDCLIKDTSYNSTIISKCNLQYEQAHGFSLSKIGPDVFRVLSIKSTDTTNPLYDNNIHQLQVNINGSNTSPKVSAGDFFVDDCNDIVNRVLGYSVNGEGGGGTPIILSSVTYDKWVKDSE